MNVKNGEQIFELAESQDSEFTDQIIHLYQTIKKPNKIERDIILLHLEGHNYEEISEITGFQSPNIGTRLGRIKNKLTRIFHRITISGFGYMLNINNVTTMFYFI